MRSFITIILLLSLFQSCKTNNQELNNLLKDCDQVDIAFSAPHDTTHRVFDTSAIKIFTELISGKNENIPDSCKPGGKLRFKRRGKVFFSAEFFVDNSNSSYVSYSFQSRNYKHRLNYRAGMFIDEEIWKAQQISLRRTQLQWTNKDTILIVNYNAIGCTCAQWSASGGNDDWTKREYIFLEPENHNIPVADDLWNGTNLPLTIQVTGQFSSNTGYPTGYSPVKGNPSPARVFRYSKLRVLENGNKQ